MSRDASRGARVGALVVAIAAIFAFRLTVDEPGPLYFIPILLAGLWFGPRGGLGAGIACAGLYALGRAINPMDEGLALFPAALARVAVFGIAGYVVGWLSQSRIALQRQVRRRDAELRELRTIQETLAPTEPEPRPGLELATCYIPAQDGVAGDFYLITEGVESGTVIAIGDVAGRGLEAAKRAWYVRTALASSAEFTEDPGEMLDIVNRSLIEESGVSAQFVTAACLIYRPEDQSLRWSVAGHEAPLALDEGTPLPTATAGLPLGVDDTTGCATSASSLSLGSGLLLYTDGLTEARRSNGDGSSDMFGEQRVTEIIARMRGEPAAKVVDALSDAVNDFVGEELADDLCIVALRVNPKSDVEEVCERPD
jgi:serine phosphatase RsbU (regulator of sigma subunit)